MSLNSNYKKWHKPNTSGTKTQGGTSRTFQGYYNVVNKEKYIGNPNEAIYRSGWEFSFMRWCDYSPSILRWSAEPISVKYGDPTAKLEEYHKYNLDPSDPRNWLVKNYHIDFYIEIDKTDHIEKWFIEIKPQHCLKKPVPPSKDSSLKIQRKFVNEAKEYLINESKWKAMNEYAMKVGARFFVFTEVQLEKLLGKFFLEKPTK
jgi:hypothetical protein